MQSKRNNLQPQNEHRAPSAPQFMQLPCRRQFCTFETRVASTFALRRSNLNRRSSAISITTRAHARTTRPALGPRQQRCLTAAPAPPPSFPPRLAWVTCSLAAATGWLCMPAGAMRVANNQHWVGLGAPCLAATPARAAAAGLR